MGFVLASAKTNRAACGPAKWYPLILSQAFIPLQIKITSRHNVMYWNRVCQCMGRCSLNPLASLTRPWQRCSASAWKVSWHGRQHIVKGCWGVCVSDVTLPLPQREKAFCVSPAISLPGLGLSRSARVRGQEAGRGKCAWACCSVSVGTCLSFSPETDDGLVVLRYLKACIMFKASLFGKSK